MALRVVEAGFSATVQDLGRRGYRRFGVPLSGAMDRFALMAANALVGNPLDAAGLEATLAGPVLEAGEDCLVAAAGSGLGLEVDGRLLPLWMAVFARRGTLVHLVPLPQGGWSYLAAAGGLDVPLVMGSRSTYLRGSFGGWLGRALQPGDDLPLGAPPQPSCPCRRTLEMFPSSGAGVHFLVHELEPKKYWMDLAGRSLPAQHRPLYSDAPRLAVLPGPQQESFTAAGLASFLSSTYRIRPDSDRMGYRLEGPPVEHQGGADIFSQGMVCGAVQVPADGQPIIAMSDCQTTGGYTQVAVIASADMPLLAQCPFVGGKVGFYPITLAEAQRRYRRQIDSLTTQLDN